jgi:hypothetical protein
VRLSHKRMMMSLSHKRTTTSLSHKRTTTSLMACQLPVSFNFFIKLLNSANLRYSRCNQVEAPSPAKSNDSSTSPADSILNDPSYPYSYKTLWFAPWLDRFRAISNDVTWGELVTKWLQVETLHMPDGVSVFKVFTSLVSSFYLHFYSEITH